MVSSLMKDSIKAESYFKQAIQFFPEYDMILINLAKIYIYRKKYEKAYITVLNINVLSGFKVSE